ncbi:MAG: RecQ family ATP-dependent DNA helicase [Bacteroidaceae bacterium]|nr:RecQ family ATP-dependent DNA helicase [Bacteroidaceae bacterium]
MEEGLQAEVTAPSLVGRAGGESVFLHILQEYFGFSSFRGIQQDIIESIGAGRDTLGLMPTGGGKSITFQVPALAMEGLCLVISPLIALMKDQVEHLRERGIKAAAVYTGMTHDEVIVALENCIFGNYKFLYVSPERLHSELFQAKLAHMKVSFITVDEAHCISQWGYDFRPSYTEIAQIRKLLPKVPVLALTATATPAVVEDIQRQLGFREPNVQRMSFVRANLAYSVERIVTTKEQTVLEILQQHPGSAIVYTRSRIATYELAAWLSAQGISATHFHAGLTHREKSLRATAWQKGDIRVMVATNAFGMGIDKPDVRCVIHFDIPDSPEAYFQEAGRAGRDGERADAILLYDSRSVAVLKRRIEDTFPPVEYVAQVYEDVCCFLQLAMGDGRGVTREFALEQFCQAFKHFPVRAYNALQLLSRAGYIEWADAEENHSRVMMICQRQELYTFQLSPAMERVIRYLLRTCTGIFSEYAYIDEKEMAATLGMTEQMVSEQLVELSRRHILRFIPRKFIPYITFVQRRVEREEIFLPKNVYADRKREMAERVQTMIGYLMTPECRSAYLVAYFGETNAKDCGICDNCIGVAQSHPCLSSEEEEALCRRILDYVEKEHVTSFTQMHFPDVPDRVLGEILHRMMLEERLPSFLT